MTAPATEAEVVLTPFLAEVRRRAEARGFAVESLLGSEGSPWVRVTFEPREQSVISVWSRTSYILTVQTQGGDPVQLVANAVHVSNVATALLAEESAEAAQ